jgi:hypothetical protein
MKSFESLKETFESLQNKEDFCLSGCTTEENEKIIDYPSYTDALYALIMAPNSSGVYISRWDLKEIAQNAGESIAIGPRKRMFELLMKFASAKEEMEMVLSAFGSHITEKIDIYEELSEQFPATKMIFEDYIKKAHNINKKLPTIIDEYF